MTTRRAFISASVGIGAALAAGMVMGAPSRSPRRATLKVLILGGTGFIGPETVTALRARGHSVTLFNRGRTEKRKGGMFPDVEKLYGNRDPNKPADESKDEKGNPTDSNSPKGLESLKGKSWDAVIDNSGYFPRIVKASAEALAGSVKQYIFISSVSVYKDNDKPGADTSAPVGVIADPTVEDFGKQFENYGPLKALCEQAAEAAMPGRTTVVRPGLIVGPGDPTGRFTYWPVRVDRGGEVLAPGTPQDPLQMIDVRDLADWLVALVEAGTVGLFDAVGPQTGLTMGSLLEACRGASGSKATFTWCDAGFLEEQKVSPWGDMPLWVPPSGDSAGMHRRDVSKSVKAGLKFRDALVTCKATLAWYKGVAEGDRLRTVGGIKPEREAEVLAAWHGREKK